MQSPSPLFTTQCEHQIEGIHSPPPKQGADHTNVIRTGIMSNEQIPKVHPCRNTNGRSDQIDEEDVIPRGQVEETTRRQTRMRAYVLILADGLIPEDGSISMLLVQHGVHVTCPSLDAGSIDSFQWRQQGKRGCSSSSSLSGDPMWIS